MKYDLISIGDPTVDTFLKIHDAEVAVRHHPDLKRISFDYAAKIPVDEFFRFPAGNMPNNAVGATRLGLKTLVYGVVGQDDDGAWIKNQLTKEGVDTRLLRTDRHKSTNSSTVLVFQAERTIFVWHQYRNYLLPALPLADWLYFTSMGPLGPALTALHRQLLGYLKSHQVKMAFNPGTYQLLMGRDALSPLLNLSEITFLNKEEAQELTGKTSSDIKVLLRALKDLGPNIAVITDGPKGSFCYDGHRYLACGIYDLPVVERTGAGDAYASGYLAARHYNLSIDEAMRWGTFNSSYVLGQFGGILGLVDKDQMDKLSQEHPELKVREI